MINKTVIFIYFILIYSAVTAIAADKVVVLPLLNSSANTASAEPWIKVFDADDTFVGYFVDGDVTGSYATFYAISSKGYLANFQTAENYSGYDWLPSVEELVYLTVNCTGPLFMRAEQFGLFRGGRPGSAFLSSGPLDFYIPLDATPIIKMEYYSGSPCTATTPPGGANAYYLMIPNDPEITGFQNSYSVPFKAVFNLPTTP